MKVMGLDISTKETGVCIAQCGEKRSTKHSIVVSGTIRLRGIIPGTKVGRKSQRWEDLHPFARIITMSERVDAYVTQYKPNFCVVEGYAFQSPKRTYLPFVAECTALCKQVMWHTNLPYIIVSPSQLKKFATGRGNCKKDEVVDFANLLIDADSKCFFDNDNEADAVMLAAFGVCLYGGQWISRKGKPKKWPQYAQQSTSGYKFDPSNGSTAGGSMKEFKELIQT